MVDFARCDCGARNPHKMCHCNTASEEPCNWCDWWTAHDDCEPEPPEEDEDD